MVYSGGAASSLPRRRRPRVPLWRLSPPGGCGRRGYALEVTQLVSSRFPSGRSGRGRASPARRRPCPAPHHPPLQGAAGAVRPWRAPVPPAPPVLARVGPLPRVLVARAVTSRAGRSSRSCGGGGAPLRGRCPRGRARRPRVGRCGTGAGGWAVSARPLAPRGYAGRSGRSGSATQVGRVDRSRLATHMPVAFCFSGLGDVLQISR